MTTSYLPRLLCLCLASFFLVHTVAGAAVALLAPVLIRGAARLRASEAARLLLAARLFPPGLAALLVLGLCIPSFLWLEAETGLEEIGFLCLGAAALGLAIMTLSMARAAQASYRSARWLAGFRRSGLPGGRSPFWIVNAPHPLVVLAGLRHPRLVVSRDVVEALSRPQLAAALRHERAHRAGRDNLKRLLILAAPGLLPGFHGFQKLERGWARFAEWAADDRATGGNGKHSLSLAAALVRVARMGSAARPHFLATSLLADRQDLAARVGRLLQPAVSPEKSRGRVTAPHVAAWAALGGAACAAIFHSSTLQTVHELLEWLLK